ncbi:NAD(P)-binding protein [Fragilariopsis cylindrus CCMP1102]|uniref:NAD(P)-binding protein n=1 Tax=Fragilariopsis cylindrus CCMP1102 TaxID=635003 RepID=A0A1E7EW98_9STRA|nr:NAD(P)-binding protein [Fragilariopsis cylindrus CCMP1102]|eukprot:OEU10065.1 NAD(P)-binding protein [Fragilariopsis cylindrus CCMP1102]
MRHRSLLSFLFITSETLAFTASSSTGNIDMNIASTSSSTSSVPTTFRALVAKSAGKSFADVATITNIAVPSSLEKDEVLIRVKYAGVNGGCETFRARGEHAFQGNKDIKDFRLGAEGVGYVVAVGSEVMQQQGDGDGDGISVGDAVCFVGSAFSEYTTSKAKMLWKIPDAKPEYVGLRISALTACAMLEQTGKIQTGETILITAAAGGAGHFAAQLAKLAGCKVIGTCGSNEKVQILKELGCCDHIINYKEQDIQTELTRIAPNGLDVVFEGVGGEILQIALDNLSPEGRILQVGYISEYPHNNSNEDDTDTDTEITSKKKERLNASEYYKLIAGCKDRVLDLYAKGKLKSLVDDTPKFVGLESVSDALEHMLSGKTTGKVVVEIQ